VIFGDTTPAFIKIYKNHKIEIQFLITTKNFVCLASQN